MKKILLSILLFSLTITIYSQGEANIWYFGDGAGLDFNSGNPVAINDGALRTVEGCATISNSAGNLLFYTDGTTVYSRDHTVMPNGRFLHGNSSSSQSAIIVPKPQNQNQYYIFTVDEHSTNQYGLQYSLVDMTLNNGQGDVLATEKNKPLLAHCTEKITAVKSDDCSSIWVIAFSSRNGVSRTYDTFHSFEVADTGVNTTSVTSTFGATSTTDGRGYLKVSSDASKLVIAHSRTNANPLGEVKLYDFNYTNGIVTNETNLNLSDTSNPDNRLNTIPYGIEFSLSTTKVYITSYAGGNTYNQSPQDGFLWQIDISGTITTKLIAYNPINTYRGALQMGPNGKIYRALSFHYDLGSNFLGVINNPEAVGAACNYQHNAVDLGAGISRQGLPPFIQSLFLPNVDIINDTPGVLSTDKDLCNGDTYRLEPTDISLYPPSTAYTWIKDGNPIIPPVTTSYIDIDGITHGTGEYELQIEYNDGGTCPIKGTASITYHSYPVITTPITITQCDDDNDGISIVDLNLISESISTNFATETITYHTSQVDANTNINAISTANMPNYSTTSTLTNPLWVRVDNQFCHAVGEVNIVITNPNRTFTGLISKCDDKVNGNNRDGISEFDLTSIENDIASQFPPSANLSISYYHNVTDAVLQDNEIINKTTYRNTNSINTERIYIRVDESGITCAALGTNVYVDLVVEKLPTANPITEIRGCDEGGNQSTFDTTGIAAIVLQGQTNVTLSYYDENDVLIPTGTFTPSFITKAQTITIRAINNTTNACYDETTLKFIVDEVPTANDFMVELCDDKPDQTDGMSVFDTSSFKIKILGNTQVDREIHYFYADGTEIVPTLPQFFNVGNEIITVEVQNKDNSDCKVISHIEFKVIVDNPVFEVSDQLLCLDMSPITVSIENAQAVYSYYWENDKGQQVGTDADTLEITEGGEYTVTATSTSMCTTTKTFVITESSIPKIETITIFDDLPNNRVSVLVSGAGDYEFTLDDTTTYEDGNEQYGHIFHDVEVGLHTIYIRDKNGCTPEITKEIVVIRFPRVITPNGDEKNDTFYVYGGEGFKTISVIIYDRYGKVITNLNEDTSWNGTYLGKIAIASDYWFMATFIDNEGKIYERKGHFSLKL